jgi:hypothetical protein
VETGKWEEVSKDLEELHLKENSIMDSGTNSQDSLKELHLEVV